MSDVSPPDSRRRRSDRVASASFRRAANWALNSAAVLAVGGGVCYLVGVTLQSEATKNQQLPSDLAPPELATEEFVTLGAMTLTMTTGYLVAIGLFVFLAWIVSRSLYSLTRNKIAVVNERLRPLRKCALTTIIGTSSEERRALRVARRLWRSASFSMKGAVLTGAIFLGYLVTTAVIAGLAESVKGKPLPSAEVTLADEKLEGLTYVRRADGFFIFMASDRKYLMIPETDVRRLKLTPRTEVDAED